MLENKKKRREKRRTSDMKAREAKKAALEIAGAIADRRSALISAAQGRGGFFPRLSNLRPDETKPGNPCTRLSFSLSLYSCSATSSAIFPFSAHCFICFLSVFSTIFIFFTSCRVSLCPPHPISSRRSDWEQRAGSERHEAGDGGGWLAWLISHPQEGRGRG